MNTVSTWLEEGKSGRERKEQKKEGERAEKPERKKGRGRERKKHVEQMWLSGLWASGPR